MTLRGAVIQAESVPGEVAQSMATAVRLADQAMAQGAELAVVPEAFATADRRADLSRRARPLATPQG